MGPNMALTLPSALWTWMSTKSDLWFRRNSVFSLLTYDVCRSHAIYIDLSPSGCSWIVHTPGLESCEAVRHIHPSFPTNRCLVPWQLQQLYDFSDEQVIGCEPYPRSLNTQGCPSTPPALTFNKVI